MKIRLLHIVILSCLTISAGCSDDYDDSKLWDSINDLENRVTRLEELCQQMNTNISSLQEIVTALQKNESIKSVSTLTDGSGYLITFSSGKTITIYHGNNGTDGEDGQDGNDGKTPTISVKKDIDGIYYWTVNGEWLIVDGNKVKAEGSDGEDGMDGNDGSDGTDGITPQFKIEQGYWYISYDNEQSWIQLGKATGDNGLDGEKLFAEVKEKDAYIEFILIDNTTFKVPKFNVPAFIIIGDTDNIFFDYGETKILDVSTYNVINISISDPDGWIVTYNSNKLSITAPHSDNKYAQNKGIISIVAISNTGIASITNIPVYCQSLLSANNKYANCYIVPSTGTYSFETKSRDGQITYSGDTADYLWMTDNNLITNISYQNNIITFNASGKKGNAVIALLDKNNKIIWSWHIWCTNTSISNMSQNINTTTWLNSNLGATYFPETANDCNNINTNISKDDLIATYGLYYQWGRKDPFISGNIAKTPSSTDVWEAEHFSTWTTPNQCNSKIQNSTWNASNLGLTMQDMASYPMHICAITSYQYLWASDADINLNWSSEQKSNYDPCPYGYRVPTMSEIKDAFLGHSYKTYECGKAFETNNNTFVWLPYAGSRDRNGGIYNIGRNGLIWASDYSHDGYHKSLWLYNPSESYSLNCEALTIRCIKDGEK